MEKADDLISWAIINAPNPDDQPGPSPAFDAYSRHVRAIVEKIIEERLTACSSMLYWWGWDPYLGAFVMRVASALLVDMKVNWEHHLRMPDRAAWRSAFDDLAKTVATHNDRLSRLLAAAR